ncbi:MAG: hypothetical protein GDA36_00190 [Rhodobacteraceae bacterium]|nr:hypothetical protein [Paracoccaceae bacterium]
MHTMSFDPKNISASVDGHKASIFDVFPEFDAADRLGVVVNSSIGILGASMLIHAFGTCYYELRRKRDGLVAQYPEVYVVHVGGRFGDLRMIDVLPERKEIFVDTGSEALAALNHAAITRVAVPGPARDLSIQRPWDRFHPWEAGPAQDRVRSSYLYAADGHVAEGATISVTGHGPQIFDNFRCIFDLEHTVAKHAQVEENPEEWTSTLLARSSEIDAPAAEAARSRWSAAREVGELRETYAFLPRATDFLHFL